MIVVVDDEPDAADVLVRLLRRTGYEAIAHGCADDLFVYLRDHTPDLIILDVNMPRVDGLDCLRRLAAEGAWRGVPVIMYSADFSEARIGEAKRLGAREYVVKGTLKWPDFVGMIDRHRSRPPTSPSDVPGHDVPQS